jgi:hypothetical protein
MITDTGISQASIGSEEMLRLFNRRLSTLLLEPWDLLANRANNLVEFVSLSENVKSAE